MGNIVNATGLRLGYNNFWLNRIFSPRRIVYQQSVHQYRFFEFYFAFLFASRYFYRRRLVLSHISLYRSRLKKKTVAVYYHDGILESFLRQILLKRFFVWKYFPDWKLYVHKKRKYSRRGRYLGERESISRISYQNIPRLCRSLKKNYYNFFWNNVASYRFRFDFANLADYKRKRIALRFVRLNTAMSSPILMAKGILADLRQVVSVRRIFKKFGWFMKDTVWYTGITVSVAGRFTRAEMARTLTARHGMVSLGSVSKPVSYNYVSMPLKYGSTTVKIWLGLKHVYLRWKKTKKRIRRKKITNRKLNKILEGKEGVAICCNYHNPLEFEKNLIRNRAMLLLVHPLIFLKKKKTKVTCLWFQKFMRN